MATLEMKNKQSRLSEKPASIPVGSTTFQAENVKLGGTALSSVLDKVEELGADRDAVQGLPLGSFIAWNRLSRGRLDGRVF